MSVRLKPDTTLSVRLKPDTTHVGPAEAGHYAMSVRLKPDTTYYVRLHSTSSAMTRANSAASKGFGQ